MTSLAPSAMETRSNRDSVESALRDLVEAASRPAYPGWPGAVGTELRRLRDAFVLHAALTEGSAGFLTEIADDHPRLSRIIGHLRSEHRELVPLIDSAIEAVRSSQLEPNGARAAVEVVADRMAVHCRLGTRLLREAFGLDLGAGG